MRVAAHHCCELHNKEIPTMAYTIAKSCEQENFDSCIVLFWFHCAEWFLFLPFWLPEEVLSDMQRLFLLQHIMAPWIVVFWTPPARAIWCCRYINIHTDEYPAGEIRGQINVNGRGIPESTIVGAWSLMCFGVSRFLQELSEFARSQVFVLMMGNIVDASNVPASSREHCWSFDDKSPKGRCPAIWNEESTVQ